MLCFSVYSLTNLCQVRLTMDTIRKEKESEIKRGVEEDCDGKPGRQTQ